jgi:glycosyltransferase involved in cell wall biosynthesis
VSERPFHHRAGFGDRALAAAGAAERAARALLCRLARAEAPVRRGDATKLAARRRAPPTAGPGTAVDAPPILVLPALPWDFRFQRPQQLALALAAAGRPVVYVEAFARQRLQPAVAVVLDSPRLQVVRLRVPGRPDPFRAPLPAAAAGPLVDALAAGLRRPPGAVLVQLPFWAPLGEALRRRFGVPLVYDRIDLHTAFPGVPAEVGERERLLMAVCDLVTATSPALAELPRSLGLRVEALPNAVAVGDFAGLAPPGLPPAGDASALHGVRAGFVGALDGRIDAEALAAAATALPGWELRLAGRVEDPRIGALRQLPNVTLLGEIPYPLVPTFLAALDVGMVPYRDLPITRAIDPVKLYEMLALGLPVALLRLPATARWEPPLVQPYDDGGGLAAALLAARRSDRDELRQRRRRAAGEESWERRAATLLAALDSLG